MNADAIAGVVVATIFTIVFLPLWIFVVRAWWHIVCAVWTKPL